MSHIKSFSMFSCVALLAISHLGCASDATSTPAATSAADPLAAASGVDKLVPRTLAGPAIEVASTVDAAAEGSPGALMVAPAGAPADVVLWPSNAEQSPLAGADKTDAAGAALRTSVDPTAAESAVIELALGPA